MEASFSDLGRIQAIEQLYRQSAYQPVENLTFTPAPGSTVTSATRLYLEGVDFNLVYFPLKHLGYKAVVGVTGELYATLSHPALLRVVLGISAKLDFPQIEQLWMGITVAAKEYGYKAVSLDLQPSGNGLFLSVSATGETRQLTAKRRPRPQSKDLLCVTGRLGAAYLGMQLLEKGSRDFQQTGVQPDMTAYRMLVGAYLRPELEAAAVARIEEAEIYPSAACFLSRGLADGVRRLSRATGLGAKIHADHIPFEGNTFQLGKQLNIDPLSAAMNGGDDFQLLLAVPILHADKFRREFPTFSIIGYLAQPEVGAVLVTPEGVEFPVTAQGWNDPSSVEQE